MSVLIQGSPEWHAERAGKILASNCAAWEGLHPYTNAKKLVREGVRQLAGEPSEIKLNAAMKHGQETEPKAVEFYQRTENKQVMETGSVAHAKYAFLRASPDGLVGLDGGLEIKSPFYAKEPYSVFAPDKVMYLWQCYVVMEVCDLEWIDFLCYINDDVFSVERVERRHGFLEEKVSGKWLPVPSSKEVTRISLWHAWFNQIQDEYQDPEKRKAHIDPINADAVEVSDPALDQIDTNVRRIKFIESKIGGELSEIDQLKKDNDGIKTALADMYGQSITNKFVTISVIKKTPPLDYKAAFEFLGGDEAVLKKGSSMESFRKTTNTRQVSIKQVKEQG